MMRIDKHFLAAIGVGIATVAFTDGFQDPWFYILVLGGNLLISLRIPGGPP